VTTRPADLVYGVDDTPPPLRLALFGLQYAVFVAVYLVFLVILARRANAGVDLARDLVGLGLIALAFGAVVQAWRGRVIGSGYLALPGYSAIYFAPALLAVEAGGLPLVAGMTIFAAIVEAVLSRLLKRLRVVFQPSIAGFTVFVVGVQLGLVGIAHVLSVAHEDEPAFGRHVAIAVATLAACVAFSVWGKGIVRLVSTLLGLALGVVLAIAGGIFEPRAIAGIGAAPWFSLPDPSVLSWRFDLALVPPFIAAALAATLRAVGALSAAQRINDAGWKRPDMDNIQRGIGADALGCFVGGILGGQGMTIVTSLVALSAATKATSRRIAYAAAAIFVVAAFVPKVAAAVVALPSDIAGAVLVFTASFLISSGIQIMMLRGIDLRTSFAISIAFLLGLLSVLDPGYFRVMLPPAIRPMMSDMLTISLFTAIALTLLFRIGIRDKQAIVWRDGETGFDDLKALLNARAKDWKLDAELIGRAGDTVDNALRHARDGRFMEAPVSADASFDGLELRIDLVYRGSPMTLAGPHGREQLQRHEESPVTAGLGHYTLGNYADRTSVSTHGNQVTLRFGFAV
jgi:NCS2 family nucleobase:cation symporter-2